MSSIGSTATARVAAAPAAAEVRLPASTIAAYAAPLIPVFFMTQLVFTYFVRFGTDVLLMAPATISLIFGLSRVWDAVTDPLAGYLSDRTTLRSGRRRPWILASALAFVVTSVMVWSPPDALAGGWLTAWVTIAVFGYMAALTIFEVPHYALGAELSSRREDRARIFGARGGLRAIGSLFAFTGGLYVLRSAADPRQAGLWLSLGVGALIVLVTGWSVSRLRERPDFRHRGGSSPMRAYRDVWRNPHGRLLLGVYFVEILGIGALGVLKPFIVLYVVKMPDIMEASFLAYFLPQIATIPIWVALAHRYPKRTLWLASMSVSAAGYGALFFVWEGGAWYVIVLSIVNGVAGGCAQAIAPAIQADVVDHDEYETGERKEGAYFAALNFVVKSASGIMVILVGGVMQWVGYQANAEQTEVTKLALRALYGIVPCVAFLIGIAMFTRFRLTEAVHQQICEQLAERRREGSR
jgi:Na+/melibiose symporter-like transporter